MGRGEFMYSDAFGEWRSVPGFDKSKLIVSSLGYCRVAHHHDSALGVVRQPSQRPTGYRYLGISRKQYRFCRLVCKAFNGPCPKYHTCDHIQKLGDKFKERGDDRACNLRWATSSDQQKNTTRTAKVRRSCIKILARHIEWDDNTPSIIFDGVNIAQRALGARCISKVLSGEFKQLNGWTFTYYDNEPAVIDGERWSLYTSGLMISDKGRIKCKPKRVHRWTPAYTPVPCSLQDYVTIGENSVLLHTAVYSTFSGIIPEGMTVDHVDRDRSNNSLSNLRLASRHDQRINQRKRRRTTAFCDITLRESCCRAK
jgi:hypothetical protein